MAARAQERAGGPTGLARERFAGCEITLSHGRTGQCWANVLAESFFASIKGQLPGLHPWSIRAAARRAVVECIAWYNGTRRHITLGYRSPAECEEDGKIDYRQ